MRHILSSALSSYREFRTAKAKNKPYQIIRNVVLVLGAAFILVAEFSATTLCA